MTVPKEQSFFVLKQFDDKVVNNIAVIKVGLVF